MAIAYTLSLIYQSKKQKATQDEFTEEYGFDGNVTSSLWLKNIIFIVGGLALLVLGSRWLVDQTRYFAYIHRHYALVYYTSDCHYSGYF